MSLITHDAGTTGATLQELPGLLKRWMGIQDEVTTLNAEIKQRRKASGVLKDMIMRIMESNNLGQLNLTKGTVVRTMREEKESMNQQYLRKHCTEFFGGDEAKANQLMQYLNEHRTTKTTTVIKLVTGNGDGGSTGSK